MIDRDTTAALARGTLAPDAASRVGWDAAVVGAGPAGALAARQLARRGLRVLLLDRAAFPRPKTCGGCLNGAALATLQLAGLGDLPARLAAPRLRATRLLTRFGRADIPLPGGVSLSRFALDAALVRAALAAGADFLPGVTIRVEQVEDERRVLALRRPEQAQSLRARVVLVADGVGGRALAHLPEFAVRVAPAARLGVGTTLAGDDMPCQPGVIYMACGRGAYLGMVRLEDGRLNLAAACDAAHLRQCGRPAAMAARLLREVGLPRPAELDAAQWRGTPPLTRARTALAGERVFVLGDAAGYVEPFTGEGMAWALAAALQVAPLAAAGTTRWRDDLARRWETKFRREFARRQRACRWMTRLLRQPRLADAATRVLSRAPWLAGGLVRALNEPGRALSASSIAGGQRPADGASAGR
jgi:flavin-dependent dehydrogenase